MFGLDKLTSGKDGRDAAKAMSDVLVNTRDSALQSIDRGTNRAISDLGRARDEYRGAQRNQLDALRSGYDTARDYGQRAYDAFTPYTNAGRNAFSQYQDAIGMNGADGRTRALGAFQAGPGYQWQVDQASDAAARKASALGLTASGNTLDAITRLGSNLANQEYGSYLDRLNGVAKMGYDATGQQAGALRDLGALATGYGRDRAGVYGQTAGNIAQTYGQQAGYHSGAGNTGGQLIANIGQGLANAASQNELAGQQAAANRAGLLMSGLQLGASVLGGGFGGGMGGGMGGGLGSLFGGGKM